MSPLTLDDLIPLSEYVAQRKQHAAAAYRYLDRYRRVRVGPQLTLIFENRQTLWFRVQELVRAARLSNPLHIHQFLEACNRLLPASGRLQAALHIDIADGPTSSHELERWRQISDEAIVLHIGSLHCPSRVVTCRPEDRACGAEHWLEFTLTNEMRAALADRRKSASIVATLSEYRHESGPLSEQIRQSLLDDLTISDRHRAA